MNIRGALAALIPLCAALLGSGCGNQHIQVDGERRSFRLHVPASNPSGQPMPLVIALHQFTDTAQGMEALTGLDAVADRAGFLVAYPQGRFLVWDTEGDADVHFIEALIDAVGAAYPVDPARIYATGASAGGMMSQVLACRTNRFAAIAPVMGSLERAELAACAGAAVAVLLVHGSADPVVPYGGGPTFAGPGRMPDFLSAPENAAFWAQRAGCGDTPSIDTIVNPANDDTATRFTYVCPGGNEVVLYRVEGGGHTWPGRRNFYPAFIVGPTSQAFDATETIWEFFSRHARGQAVN